MYVCTYIHAFASPPFLFFFFYPSTSTPIHLIPTPSVFVRAELDWEFKRKHVKPASCQFKEAHDFPQISRIHASIDLATICLSHHDPGMSIQIKRWPDLRQSKPTWLHWFQTAWQLLRLSSFTRRKCPVICIPALPPTRKLEHNLGKHGR